MREHLVTFFVPEFTKAPGPFSSPAGCFLELARFDDAVLIREKKIKNALL